VRTPHTTTFDAACSLIEAILTGGMRQAILADVLKSPDFREALAHLRERMRANEWTVRSRQIRLGKIVAAYDTQARSRGLHVLHDWDGKADRLNEDTIPVDVLNYVLEKRGAAQVDKIALAILLDYHFLFVLMLLSLRIWDEGDADESLDRLNELLLELQNPNGSGQAFLSNAETLLLLAGSHYELDGRGYDMLLDRVKTLNHPHRLNVALGHAVGLGSHLRFGFEATYGHDTGAMRDDNVVDYPWLCFSLSTLMREYARMHEEGVQGVEREVIIEAMLNGLCPDASAFIGDQPPASLSACERERAEFAELFERHKSGLLEEFERHRPSDHAYSPLSFFFNFSQNVLKGTVIDSLLWGDPWKLTLNDLLTGIPRGDTNRASKETLARTLMRYARSSPDRIRGRPVPAIVYDPPSGRRAFTAMMRGIAGSRP